MSADMWATLRAEAFALPVGPARVATLQRAVEAADGAGDEIAAADVRLELVWEADRSGDPVAALTAYAWVRGRYDRDPENFASFARRLDWQAKWMPELAIGHPTVPLAQIEGLIDDVERYHVVAGAGARAALDLRLTLLAHCGDPAGQLPEVLAAWRAAARAGLSDCEACERLEEAEAILAIGDPGADADALAVLDPVVAGSVSFCSSGPARPLALAVPLLARSGRLDEARRSLRRASTAALDGGVAAAVPLADLAASAAAAGLPGEAARLARVALGVLGELRSPLRQLQVCRALLWALPAIEASGVDALALSGTPPQWLAPGPMRLDVRAIVAALSATATQLAHDFDARNGTSHQADLLVGPLPVLPSLAAAAPDTPKAASPESGSSFPELEVASVPRTTRIGPVPADADGFESWAHNLRDRFELEAVHAAAARLADDTGTAIELRAAAVLNGVLADRRDSLITAPGLPESFRIRLQVWAIRDGTGSPSATLESKLADLDELARRAAALVEEGGGEGRPIAALRSAQSAYAIMATAGADGAVAVAALAILADESAFGDSPVVDLQRWTDVAWGAAELLSRPDAGEVVNPLASVWLDEATRALYRHRALWPGTAAVAAQAIARLAFLLGRPVEAAVIATSHLPVVEELSTPAAAQTALALAFLLADARAARNLGPYAAGQAKRGQARLLAHMRRFDESIVAAAEAAALTAEAGDVAGSAEILFEQARTEAAVNDWRQVGVTASLALDRLPEAPSAAQVRVALMALIAESAEKTGASQAAERWVAAADAAAASGACPAGYRSAAARLSTDRSEADALFAEALTEADTAPTSQARAWYRALVRQRRAVALVAADPEAAAADAAASVEDWLLADDLANAGRSRWIEGDARLNANDVAGARKALAAGVDLAHRAGADDLAKSIRSNLEGIQSPRSGGEAPDGT